MTLLDLTSSQEFNIQFVVVIIISSYLSSGLDIVWTMMVSRFLPLLFDFV